MKLAFEKGYMRDIDDPAIQALPAEYEPKTLQDAYNYIKNHRPVSYYSVNFDLDKIPVLAIDFGSHTEFCYLWDLNEDNKKEFTSPVKKKESREDEETARKRFAHEILYNLKQRNSLSYEEAVAISHILKLGGE